MNHNSQFYRLIFLLTTVLLSTAMTFGGKVNAQTKSRTITGTITDEAAGEALIGAVVQVKGTTIAATADIDGKYSISVPSGNATLIFSYVGCATKEVVIGKTDILNVVMAQDANLLDDVVVVGYGQQKKGHLISSIQSISPSDLKMPSASLSTGFAGRLAGVIAVQRNGQPGADQADFWIRGISTFGSATNPLIILDGVSIDASELNGLDPEIIESFSVLKDATATALYGSRGANGVMIVTTKSGENMDKPIVNFRFETSVSTPTSRQKMADAATYMEMYNEAVTTRGTGQILYTQDKINGTKANKNKYIYPDVDWYNEMFKDAAVNENLNFNIRGGGKRADYFMSATLRHEEGMLKSLSKDYFSYDNNYSLWRYAFQNNVNVNLTETTKVEMKINTQLTQNHDQFRAAAQSSE